MPTVLTDAKGRALTLRTLTVLDQARVMRAIGAAQSMNQPYVAVVQAACAVAEIDGVPLPMPRDEATIDALIERVGDEGFVAITEHFRAAAEALNAAAAEGDAPKSPLVTSAS